MMSRLIVILIFLLSISYGSFLSAIGPDKSFKAEPGTISSEEPNIPENQILYNGRVWRNLYTRIKGDQFLFSNDFQPGTVTISGKLFKHLEVLYVIYNSDYATDYLINIQGLTWQGEAVSYSKK